MSKANAESVDGAGRRRATDPGGQSLSTMEGWLRRAMADLAAHGANDAAPIDLTQSLTAMATLLHDAIQSEPARIVTSPTPRRANAPGVEEANTENLRSTRGSRDEFDMPAQAATGRAGSAGVAASTGADTLAETPDGRLLELSFSVDELERRLREGAGGDQSLQGVLTRIEAQLRRLIARRERIDKAKPAAGDAGRNTPNALPHSPSQTDELIAPLLPEAVDLSNGSRELTAPDATTRGRRAHKNPQIPPLDRGFAGEDFRTPPMASAPLGEAAAHDPLPVRSAKISPSVAAHAPGQPDQGPVDETAARAGTDRTTTDGGKPDPFAVRAAVDAPTPPPETPNASSERATSARAPEQIELDLRALVRHAEETIARSCDPRIYDALSQKVEATQRQLAEEFETGLTAAATETNGLRGLVQTLVDKIEAMREPAAGEAAIDALRREIARIIERLDGVDKGFAPLANLEQSIARLYQQVDETRRAVSAAAARNAERTDSPQPGALAECEEYEKRVTREIADFRAARDEADKRVHLALNAVQETIGKVSDRLAKMEADLEEIQPVRDSFLPMLTPRAERRQKSAARNGALQNGDLSRDSFAAAPGPVLVKTRDGPEPGHFGRDAAQSSDADKGDAKQSAELADFLIEPGAGFPRPRELTEPRAPAAAQQRRERETGAARAEFIAATRRAAQTGQPDAEGTIAAAQTQHGANRGAPGGFFNACRRPLILGLTALCLALGAYALAKLGGFKRIDSPGFPKFIGKGSAFGAPSAAMRSKPAAPTPQAGTAAHGAPHETPNGDSSVHDSGLLDPVPLNSVPAQREPAASGNSSLGADAPITRAIAGSDPIVVGAILSTAAASKPDELQKPRLAAGVPTIVAAVSGLPLDELRREAEAGGAAAQFELGARFADGRAGSRDLALAAQYYARAADAGLALAQYRLAVLTEEGVGVSRDLARARDLYLAAAAQGNARAMHNLGVLAAQGFDGRPNYASAAAWFEKAAEFNIHDSQFNLAVLLARGFGVPRDEVRSYTWFSIAAANGDAEASRKRDETALKLSAAELAAATTRAKAFRPRPLDQTVNEMVASPRFATRLSAARE